MCPVSDDATPNHRHGVVMYRSIFMHWSGVFVFFPRFLCSLPLCSSADQPPLSHVHYSPQQMRGMSATTVHKQEQLHEDALQQQQSPHHTRNAHDHDVWTTCVESSGDACVRAVESPFSLATSFVLSHFLAHTGFRISASSSRRPIVPRPRRRPGALPLSQPRPPGPPTDAFSARHHQGTN